jgi:hypothetical protein
MSNGMCDYFIHRAGHKACRGKGSCRKADARALVLSVRIHSAGLEGRINTLHTAVASGGAVEREFLKTNLWKVRPDVSVIPFCNWLVVVNVVVENGHWQNNRAEALS